MKPYIELKINNIAYIRQQLIDIISPRLNNEKGIVYDQNLSKLILELPCIQEMLVPYGGTTQVISIAYNIFPGNTRGKIHIDDGDYVFTLNIPIINYENTFLNLYSTTKPPRKNKHYDIHGNEINYYNCKLSDCILTHNIETTEPHIFNTKLPHEVVNANPTTRVNVLFRLALTATLSHLE